MNEETIDKILQELMKTYPSAECELNFSSPYELLVATILSAQCTDVRVNIVTSELFKEYNTPEKIVSLTEDELGERIKTCGLYKTKGKNIMETSKVLIRDYNSEVPGNMEDLIRLPGVGRKTANVVLSNAFGIPAIAVDTHVFRVSNRIGIAKGKTPEAVENELMNNIPKELWSHAHHLLIWHGRYTCKARKPECERCPIAPWCQYFRTCV